MEKKEVLLQRNHNNTQIIFEEFIVLQVASMLIHSIPMLDIAQKIIGLKHSQLKHLKAFSCNMSDPVQPEYPMRSCFSVRLSVYVAVTGLSHSNVDRKILLKLCSVLT